MLVIRLSRIGHENLQRFRLVVQEKTASPKSGKVIAIVGSYDPRDPENKLTFDAEQIEKFLKNGAEPSDTVARLLIKNGFKKELVGKFVMEYKKQKSKSEKEAPAEAKKVEAAEKPAEVKEAEAPAEAEAKAAEKPAEKVQAEAEAAPEEKPAEDPKQAEKPEAEEKAEEQPVEAEQPTKDKEKGDS